MTKTVCYYGILSIVLCSMMPLSVSGQINLLKNGGFEQGQDKPSGWFLHRPANASPKVITKRTTKESLSGNASAVISVPDDVPIGWYMFRQIVPIKSGVEYRFSGWVKTSNIHEEKGAYISITFRGKKGRISSKAGSILKNTCDWIKVSVEAQAPKEATSVCCELILYGHGKAWFDDMTFEPVGQRMLQSKNSWTLLDWSKPELLVLTKRKKTGYRIFVSPWQSSNEKKALYITYDKWKKGSPPCWPAVIIDGALLSKPKKQYEKILSYITFKAKNIGKSQAYWGLHFRNYYGGRWAPKGHTLCQLEPGEEKTFIVDISGLIKTFGSWQNVAQMHIYTENPPETMKLVISNIKLVPAVDKKIEKLTAKISDLKRWVMYRIPEGQAKLKLFKHLDNQSVQIERLQSELSKTLSLKDAIGIANQLDEIEKTLRWIKSEPARIRACAYIKAHHLKTDWLVGIESPMIKVAYEALPFTGRFGNELVLDGAKGETVHGQIVIVPTQKTLKNVKVIVSELKDKNGNKLKLLRRVVGYVFAPKPHMYDVPYSGWWPDLLLDYMDKFDVPHTAQQAVWITCHIPYNATSGIYNGKIIIKPENSKEQIVNVTLSVRHFAIPKERHLRLALNYEEREGPRIYGKRWNNAMKWKYREFLLKHRFTVDSIYGILPMWKESVEDLKRLKAGGQNFFTIAVFNNTNAPGFGKHTDTFLANARKAGIPRSQCWFYGYDESGPALRGAISFHAAVCHKRWPGTKVMTTGLYELVKFENVYSNIDAWVPALVPFQKYTKFRTKLKKLGKEVWYYWCIGPWHPYPNTFVEYPAIEARLLFGFMARKMKTDGILYYSINRVMNNSKPVDDGPLTSWIPTSYDDYNGDGCWIAYGPDGPISTIRFENIRDGIEDYEVHWLLVHLVGKLEAKKELLSLQDSKFLNKAKEICNVPDNIVRSMADYTYDPSQILQYRKQIYDTIEKLQRISILH